MIVERLKFVTKPGRVEEVMKMIQDVWDWPDFPKHTHRIYMTISGQHNAVFQEIEFEGYDARAKYWADLISRPEWAQWSEKWWKLIKESSREHFSLVE